MKKLLLLSLLAVVANFGYSSELKNAKEKEEITAEQALIKLIEGNKRYLNGKSINPNKDKKRREEIAAGQHPFAIILTCSDSRVSPEVLFDQGMGDIFVIRNAGNIVDDVVLGSIEYGAEHLHTPLIVVLGHERCGAISAAVAGGEVQGHIVSITTKLQDSVVKAKEMTGDAVDNCVNININETVKSIEESQPILEELIKKGEVKVVGAYYDLDTGEVKFKK